MDVDTVARESSEEGVRYCSESPARLSVGLRNNMGKYQTYQSITRIDEFCGKPIR